MTIQIADVGPCSKGMTSVVTALQCCRNLHALEIVGMDTEHHEIVAKLRSAGGKESTIFVYDVEPGLVKLSAVVTFEDFPAEHVEAAKELTRQEASASSLPITLSVNGTGNLEAELIVVPGLPTEDTAARIEAFVHAANRLDCEFEKFYGDDEINGAVFDERS